MKEKDFNKNFQIKKIRLPMFFAKLFNIVNLLLNFFDMKIVRNSRNKILLENEEYDSLLFLSNDIILHGYNFVDTLRKEMFEQDYTILSPSVIQVRLEQDMWKQMHNYGTKNVRQVPWVDYMSPLIHRRLIEEIKQFDMNMIYGWGLDMYSGIICEQKGWKIGVVDYLTAVHLVAKTTKEGKADITPEQYFQLAQSGMDHFFSTNGLDNEKYKMMALAQNYTP